MDTVSTNRGKKKERVQSLGIFVKTPVVETVFCLLHGGRERQRLTDTVIKEKKKEWVFSTRCMSWGTGSQCLTSEGLKILKLSQVQHPQILLQMEVTKAEVITYQTVQALADSIKSHWWTERIPRGRTLLTYRIGERQTVQNYQHSPTC